MSIQFKRPQSPPLILELTPLIDVIFQLLIFFMISSSFLYPALALKLPTLENTIAHSGEQLLVVSVDESGQYFVNHEPVAITQLKNRLEAALADVPSKSVFFRAHKTLPYEQVLDTMHVATQAGCSQFNFIFEQSQKS
jgi:biopolymer transport protein ExbD